MLLARGVPAKYLTLVFQQIKQESDGRQKKDKPVEDGPKAASSASGTAHVGKRARRAQVEEGLAPATAPGQGSAASAHVSASPRDGGMDIDMEDHGDIDEDGNAAIEGATQGAAEAGADAGADVNVRVQMTLNSGTGMTRSVSGNTDSSEERQVERMMALLSPEASADVPLVPITEPVAPLPVAASGTSQSLPPTPNASQRQPPKPQQLHQPLRLAASSSWTPTPPPAGPRALQTRLQSQQPPVSRAVPIEPPPIGTSTQRGEAGSANTPNSASMSRAALLKAKLLASRAAQAASPVYAPLASTVAPITQSAPDSSSATAPLNPLARPFASAPSRAIPIVAPGLASTPASIAGSAVAPIFVSSSASDPDSEPKTSKVTAKPLAPVRDLTATLQARTAALEARRKAMESMRAKRQQVKAELSVDNAVLEGANQEEASTSTSLSSTSNSLSQTDPSGSHTLEQADAMTSAPGEDGKMELDDDNELADLKADLDSMVKEAAEKEAQVEAQEQAQAETAAQVSAEGSGNETPVQSVSEEVVDMEPEEGEISEGSPPPPTRSFTPGSSLPPTAASNTGPTVLNKRKRPTALDFDYPSSGTASPHLGPGSNLHPSKKRFGGIGFSYSTRPHAALPYAERVAIEREKVRLTYELPAEEDDSSDEDEQDERAQVKRWKQAAEDSPVPEIRIPDEYDPKKQLRDHTLRMREVEERIRLAQAKIDARKRKAKAGGDVKGMSAAMLDEADASGTPSAQMSRAVSDVSVAAVEDGAKGGVDECK